MRWVLAFLGLLAVGMGVAYVGWSWFENRMHEPVSFASEKIEFEVEAGVSLKKTLYQLKARGVCNEPELWYAYARLHRLPDIKVGYYEIHPQETPLGILQKFINGDELLVKATIPEGYNRWQVRDVLVAEGWLSAVDFDRICDDIGFLRAEGITTPSCEGAMFPSTYAFPKKAAPKTIFRSFFALYKKTLQDIQKEHGRGPLKFDDNAMTTLASVVEKETGHPEERAHIACVFYNRLQAKPPWRLETDPTVAYAATLADPTFDGNIKKWHLTSLLHPYNTYKFAGLPPGPVANPGKEALLAVANPSPCPDYFFVSMNNGQHVFCPDLKCHSKSVNYWQKSFFLNKRKQ